MSPRWLRNSAVCAALATLASTGCATTQYQPQLAARGELLLRYDGGFVMQAQGQTVARALSYRGLDRFVACVPEAHQHARSAQKSRWRGDCALGHWGHAVFGLAWKSGGLGRYPTSMELAGRWAGGGRSWTDSFGAGMAGKNQANGHALDAMNHYNDAVGAWGKLSGSSLPTGRWSRAAGHGRYAR